ncbi:MAG TPA: radical SAM-associated putative lipoprotein [Bacteroidales bacterium]|nr:radical SAM-associated putative lipoprotein [Bacteroidales bacterium]
MLKTIKVFLLRTRAVYLKYLLKFMGLAGFSMLLSCTKYGAPVAEYGVIADYNLNFHGTVLSEDSLKPIKNINIKLSLTPDDTLTSNTSAQGTYSINKPAHETQQGALIFTDTDGTQNGSFYQKSITFEVTNADINNLEHITNINLVRKP